MENMLVSDRVSLGREYHYVQGAVWENDSRILRWNSIRWNALCGRKYAQILDLHFTDEPTGRHWECYSLENATYLGPTVIPH